MAVRQCETCEELIQEGYTLEDGAFYIYCSDNCMHLGFSKPYTEELKRKGFIEWHDWQPHQMDAEDFQLLLNKLQSDTEPQDIANVLDILNTEESEYYAPEGVLNHFITYVNGLSYYL